MARIAGIDLPLGKCIEIGLPSIFGLCRQRSGHLRPAAGSGLQYVQNAIGGMKAIREKSIALTELFIKLIDHGCGEFTIATPRDANLRGSQVSIACANGDGYAIMQALIARGVIGDFRAPDILRFGFTPLYVGYRDVWQAVEILEDILRTGAWQDARFAVKTAVT